MSTDSFVKFHQAMSIPCVSQQQYRATASGAGTLNVDGKIVNGSILSIGANGQPFCASRPAIAVSRPPYFDGFAVTSS